MRLVTLRTGDGTRAGRVDGDRVIELAAADVGRGLADGPGAATAETGPGHRPHDVDPAPLVPRPGKGICPGLNSRAHVEEMGGEVPAPPTLFAKYAGALTGARDPIVLPRASRAVDWEAELCFVIGRRVRG